MKQGQCDVKSKRKGQAKQVVGQANYPIYDSVVESIEAEGEAEILKKINGQAKTNAMNTIRGDSQERVGKKMLETKAIAAITPTEWGDIAGDAVKIRAKIDAKMAELEEEMKTAQAQEAATAA